MSEKNHSVDSSNATKPEDNLQAVLDKIKRLEAENKELKANQPILVSKDSLRSAYSAAKRRGRGDYGVFFVSQPLYPEVSVDDIWEQLNKQQ